WLRSTASDSNKRMHRLRWFCMITLVLAGCASPSKHDLPPAETGAASTPPVIVTPAQGMSGRVALANMQARYVVLTFPLGAMPQADQKLNLYRDGLKVGEIRVTGMQRDNNTIADIVAGDARVGDEVR